MNQIATDIETQGIVLYDNKWARFDTIQAFTTVDECIYYEATPYDCDGSTCYRNNVTDWQL